VADLMAGRLLATTSDVRVVSESRMESRIDATGQTAKQSTANVPAMLTAAVLVVAGFGALGYALLKPEPLSTLASDPEQVHAQAAPSIAPRSLPPANLFAQTAGIEDRKDPSPETRAHPSLPAADSASSPSPWAELANHLDEPEISAQTSAANPGTGLGRSDTEAATAVPATSASVPMPAPRPRAPSAPALHGVRINVQPWGEVWVDGRQLGVSPPIREIQLPAGRHRVELRNASFPTQTFEIEAGASVQAQIDHRFVASGSTPQP
jgi:hypothetical protein